MVACPEFGLRVEVTDWTKKADECANYIVKTDFQIAELKVKHERDKRKAKRKWSAIFLRVTGSVEARKAQAEIHPDYELAVAGEMTSLLEYEKLRNKRETANTIIEFWRSYNKAMQQGHV